MWQVFGDIDDELYKGDMLYTPIVKKWYYEVVITDIAVDGESLNLDCKKVGRESFDMQNITHNITIFCNHVFFVAV